MLGERLFLQLQQWTNFSKWGDFVKELEFKNKLRKLLKEDNLSIMSMSIIGVFCAYDKYFVPWLYEMSQKHNIDVSKYRGSGDLFQEIKRIYEVDKKIMYLVDEECYTIDEGIYIGIPLEMFDDGMSIKRMKIEVYNELEKMNLINYRIGNKENLDCVRLFNDIVIFEEGTL